VFLPKLKVRALLHFFWNSVSPDERTNPSDAGTLNFQPLQKYLDLEYETMATRSVPVFPSAIIPLRIQKN